MLSPADRVGPYVVEKQIGSGQLAEVYRARDERVERYVALKILHGSGERDRAEAQAVAALIHPKIVPLFDIFLHEGRLCLVQKWMDGGSLESELDQRGKLRTDETLQVGLDVAAALEYAHHRGILHRDLKPSNVLRDSGGSYLLTDFGAVGRLDIRTGLTSAGQIAGTPLYMSPEQVTGARQGPASDLFGLGMLLFRCEYGRLPAEASGSVLEVLRQRISAPIKVPGSPLQGLIAQCLQLDPSNRPASAHEVLKWLRTFESLGLPALSSAPASVHGPDIPDIAVLQPAAPPPSESALSKPALPRTVPRVPVVVGLFVLAAVAVSMLTFRRDNALGIGGDGVAPAVLTGIGLTIAGLSVALAMWLRRRWEHRSPEAAQEAARIVLGAQTRTDLTRSLIIEVDELLYRLSSLDQRILGVTVRAMLKEYETSKTSSDRQSALLNVVTLMDKVQDKLAPWHVRHREAVTTAIAIVGCLTGLTGALGPFLS